MDLEPSANIDLHKPDARPKMPEPLPVWLIAIEDVHLPAAAGVEVALDEFYVGLLQFKRDEAVSSDPVYFADNFALIFDIFEPPLERQDMRPVGVEVVSLVQTERQLIERKIEFQWQRGLVAERDTLLTQDPAGNWVSLCERRNVG